MADSVPGVPASPSVLLDFSPRHAQDADTSVQSAETAQSEMQQNSVASDIDPIPELDNLLTSAEADTSQALQTSSMSLKTLERAIGSEELRVVVDVVKNDRSTVTAWFTFFSLNSNENLAAFRKRFDEAVLNKTLQRQGVENYAFYCEMKSRSGDLFPIDGDLQWTAVKPKLALHPDRYRLYVHVTQNVELLEGKRETRVSVIPKTDEQALEAIGQETAFLFTSGNISECKNVFYVPNPISPGPRNNN